jgi:hypothetical protein
MCGGSINDCFGRLTVEHVKEELRMGIRAPSDLLHCIALCEGHSENGARGGAQWNTRKENREAMRNYLSHVNRPVVPPLTETELWHAYRNTVAEDE